MEAWWEIAFNLTSNDYELNFISRPVHKFYFPHENEKKLAEVDVQKIKITIQCKKLDQIGWNLEWWNRRKNRRNWLHKKINKNLFPVSVVWGFGDRRNLCMLTQSKMFRICFFIICILLVKYNTVDNFTSKAQLSYILKI